MTIVEATSPDDRSPSRVLGARIETPGATLAADLYVPFGEGPFPAVVEITPYGAKALSSLGATYAARGYLFFAVDARGRYRSSGRFDPLTHDQSDGHAVLRWLAAHPLSNGRIGTRGHSYAGYSQLLTAIDAPPSLRAMVVGVAPGDPFENVPFQGGAYDLDDLAWLMGITGSGDEDEDEDEDEDGDEDALMQRPFGEVDVRLGGRHEVFRRWVSHWRLDDFWRERSVGPRLGRTNVPTLFVSGWWDGNGRGAPTFFRGMRERTRLPATQEAQRLVIGPWNHDLEAPNCGDLPEAARLAVERGALRDSMVDEMAWLDRHLRDVPAGPSTSSRVSLFVTGLGRWKDFSDWPPREARCRTLHLAPGALGSAAPAEGTAPSRYVYDPDDPTPFSKDGPDKGPFDSAKVTAGRADVARFDGPRLEEPLAIVGDVSAFVFASSDAPDFDVYAKLLDLHPDGRAIFLTDGILRVRFRRGFDRPELLEPGEIAGCRIDLWHVGHVLAAGHALRLEIASAAFPRFDPNPCTGGDLAEEIRARPARIAIHHDARHPSRLLVPVLERLP